MPSASSENPVTGYESITVSTSAKSLTAATFGSADYAEITIEDAPIRYRLDGTDPTGSEGHKAGATDVIRLQGPAQLADFSVIRADAAGTDATIRCSYYGP